MKEISIIIPIFNEATNMPHLHKEIKKVCGKEGYEYELIIVDDGSTDKTPDIVRQLSHIKYIRFRKNFGQTAAIDAGIKNSKYPLLIPIDGDGQNDPAEIPRMIEYLEKNNLDVVSGWRKERHDSLLKKFISYGAYSLRRIFINDGIHDSGCTLKVYKRECFDHLTLYGEMHRFIPALLRMKGFRIGEIPINHRPRDRGKSKYNWTRIIKGFLDILSLWFWNKYAVRPLHLLGTIGIGSLFLGILFGVISIYLFFRGEDLSNTVYPLLTLFMFITGIQMFIAGLLADVLSKNYYETTRDISYSILEIIDIQ